MDNQPRTTGEGEAMMLEQANAPLLPGTGADMEVVALSLFPALIVLLVALFIWNRIRNNKRRWQ